MCAYWRGLSGRLKTTAGRPAAKRPPTRARVGWIACTFEPARRLTSLRNRTRIYACAANRLRGRGSGGSGRGIGRVAFPTRFCVRPEAAVGVMVFLVLDVANDSVLIVWADAEVTVVTLPLEPFAR